MAVVLEHSVEWDTEHRCNAERYFERRRVFAELDGIDGLPSHADPVGELLLRHLPVIEAKPPNCVVNRHGASGVSAIQHNLSAELHALRQDDREQDGLHHQPEVIVRIAEAQVDGPNRSERAHKQHIERRTSCFQLY